MKKLIRKQNSRVYFDKRTGQKDNGHAYFDKRTMQIGRQ